MTGIGTGIIGTGIGASRAPQMVADEAHRFWKAGRPYLHGGWQTISLLPSGVYWRCLGTPEAPLYRLTLEFSEVTNYHHVGVLRVPSETRRHVSALLIVERPGRHGWEHLQSVILTSTTAVGEGRRGDKRVQTARGRINTRAARVFGIEGAFWIPEPYLTTS